MFADIVHVIMHSCETPMYYSNGHRISFYLDVFKDIVFYFTIEHVLKEFWVCFVFFCTDSLKNLIKSQHYDLVRSYSIMLNIFCLLQDVPKIVQILTFSSSLSEAQKEPIYEVLIFQTLKKNGQNLDNFWNTL